MDIRKNGIADTSPILQAAAFVIVIAGMIYAKSIITPLLLALFISIICEQPVSWMERKKIPRWLALIIVILAMIFLFTGFAFIIGGTISSFTGDLSEYEASLTTISDSFFKYLRDNGINVPQDQIFSLLQPAKILEITAGALNKLVSMMGNTFLIFLIVLFTLTEFSSFPVKANAILKGSDRSVSYFSTILQNVRHYLGIKTIICLLTGILVYVALLIIGVDYPLLWALIAAIMNYIPNIGSIIAAVPAVLFALVQLGLGHAIWTLASFMVVNNVLGNFIEPRIMGKGLGLSTLVVFLSLIFWGFVFGTVGMFLSVPLTMTIKIILEQNEKTRWISIILGTPSEAEILLNKEDQSEKK
jgi:AI-2 transport protein TqsA